MTAFISGALGGFIVGIATFLTTRYSLLHAYDQALRDKRLKRYQELFHLSKCFPRYWLPSEGPSREDLRQFREDFHNWYFGEKAGGMFLTQKAKDRYLAMLDTIANAAEESKANLPLTTTESKALIDQASDLRHQLAQDVGAANPPRLRWIRLRPTLAPILERQATEPKSLAETPIKGRQANH